MREVTGRVIYCLKLVARPTRRAVAAIDTRDRDRKINRGRGAGKVRGGGGRQKNEKIDDL